MGVSAPPRLSAGASVHSHYSHSRGCGGSEGMGLRGLMGKKIRKPREEAHTNVPSRGFHILARGELSFYLPMAISKMEI